jgi:hypothetical protein
MQDNVIYGFNLINLLILINLTTANEWCNFVRSDEHPEVPLIIHLKMTI